MDVVRGNLPDLWEIDGHLARLEVQEAGFIDDWWGGGEVVRDTRTRGRAPTESREKWGGGSPAARTDPQQAAPPLPGARPAPAPRFGFSNEFSVQPCALSVEPHD